MDSDEHAPPPELANDDRRATAFAQGIIAVVSHDLRNPLDAILTGTQLAMQMQPQAPGVARVLERVLNSARRAERLVHDLLDYSQVCAVGSIPLRLEHHDVAAVARDAVDEAMLATKALAISFVADGDTHATCDADRITQIIVNLISNAATYGKPDRPIVVRVRGDGDEIRASVINENMAGPIPEALIPRLFEAFNRGLAAGDPGRRSLGLGLYIADQIAKGHRGRIDVTSTRDLTTFTLSLPTRPHATAPDGAPSR